MNARARCRRRAPGQRGFTLLEVLVAVAILGLGLSVILSAQAGLFNNATRAENMSRAPELLRCKMNEVEVDLLEKGYGVIDQKDSEPCCSDESDPHFSCEWSVQLIKLPEPSSGAFAGDAGIAGDNGGLGALSALAQAGGLSGAAQGTGQPPDLGTLASSLTESGGNPIDGVAGIVMSMVYPQLKPMLEASIRRVTITVVWKEGKNRRELSAVQFVTNPQQGGFDPGAAAGLEGLEDIAGSLTGNPGGTNPGGTNPGRPSSPFVRPPGARP